MKLNEDWLAVIIAFVFVILILIGAMPKLPWPIIGIF